MPPLVEQVSLLKQRNPDKYDFDDTTFDSLTLDSKYI